MEAVHNSQKANGFGITIIDVCTAAIVLVGVLAELGGCTNPTGPTPVDNPPVITSFSVTPGTAKQNQPVTFNFQGTDDNGLSQAILTYEAGAADTLAISGTSYTGTRSHTYLSDGVKAPTLTLKDNAGQRTSKSISLGVDATLPPVFNDVPLSGLEGDTLEAKINSMVIDPQSEALSVVATSLDPAISAVVAGDRIRVYGGADMNGSHQFKVVATNTDGKTAERIYTGVWAPMDKIIGRIFDEMEAQYATGIRPELSLTTGTGTGNITDGFVIIDNGAKVKPDKNGVFSYPKIKGGPHTLQAFIAGRNKVTGNLDSSFVATYDLPAGDQTFNAGVNTNAGVIFSDGTNWPLAFFKKLLYVYNFKGFWSDADEGKLKGMNLQNAKQNTYWLTQDSIKVGYRTDLPIPSDQIDNVKAQIMKYFSLLPEAWRPNVYVGKPGETQPLMKYARDTTLFIPKPGFFTVAQLPPSDPASGTNALYNSNAIVIAGHLTFKFPSSENGAQMREIPAPIFNISDYFYHDFDGLSEFSSWVGDFTPAKPTNSGIKAIYLNGLFNQGTDFEKFWKMPF